MFILGNERDDDVESAFDSYTKYLKENSNRFPTSAYKLATSTWYFGFSDHKAPHDAWLEKIVVSEPATGERNEVRKTSITINLLSAYHTGVIEFHYPEVYEYQLSGLHIQQGLGDWRYDEFRINDKGQLVHEIEWASWGASNSWVIVASDVHHKWVPNGNA